MAKECGWDKDYIAENLTLDQIRRYYDVLYKEKLKDLKLQTVSTMYATARAFGSLKNEDFKKYLDSLDLKPVDVNKSLRDANKLFPGLVEDK